MQYLNMNKDFDSNSSSYSSTSTMTSVGPNGSITQKEVTESKSSENKEPETEVQEYKFENFKPNEVPEVYESGTLNSANSTSTYKGMIGDEQNQLNIANNKADKAMDLEKLIGNQLVPGDESYENGEIVVLNGVPFAIGDYDDPVNAIITSDTAENKEAKLYDSALDRYMRDYGFRTE